MADVVISVILQMALENAASLVMQESGCFWHLDEELNKLSNSLSRILASLRDAEQRQIRDESLRVWLRDLKRVAYDADDVLDLCSFRALQSQMEEGKKVCNFLFFFSSSSSSCFSANIQQVRFVREIARRIKDVRERLDEIAKDRDNFHLRICDGHVEIREERPQTSSLIYDESDVYGRKVDKIKMIEILVSDDVSSVVPIVGMGGLGKTTLAQLVFNDEHIKNLFELRLWVCVSEDFDVRRVTKAIIESATNTTPEATELDPLQMNLKEILRGKRFLLVLDDVWSENSSEWDVLKAPFKVGANGSKIIVTTRSERVSMIVGTVPFYRLKGLSEDDCWSLLKRCASVERSLGEYLNLEAIGKEIVRKCGGLPLAIKTIGSLLRFKMDETEWDLILKSEIWDLPTNNSILPALRLSYHHLRAHVKQCFVYCSIFPKDYGFEKDTLVQLWMAQGFIQPKGLKQMEEVGGEYFDELLLRSFFQYSHNDWEDQPIYKMHDLIHDLARYLSGDESCRMENMDSCVIFEHARHSSLLCEIAGPLNFQAFYKANRLRTFLLLGATNSLPHITHPPIVIVPHDMFRTLRFLRVLDLSYASIVELPCSIGNLKHLRYLDISRASIKRLPDSISRLYNLQTLRLKKCVELIELPKDMSNLINLRHLYMHTRVVNCNPQLISMPPRIGKMTDLQTLSLFVVGRESGCGIEELKGMRNLRGSICISKLENVVNEEHAKAADLISKEYLHELELQWSPHNLHLERVEEVLTGLKPHVNIRVLGIFQYGGIEFPSWMTDSSFFKLETVYIFNCRKCNILPPLGQLPSLTDLYIRGMYEVKRLGPEFCGISVANRFPSLETLELEDMPAFEEWSGVEEGDFCSLKELELIDCPKLKGLPYLPITNLSIRNCEELSALPRLPSLCDLDLNGCNEVILSDLSHLISLSSLSISGFPRLKSLPEGLLRSLTTLKQLYIGNFNELTSLPEGVGLKDLAMLERLVISSCPQLTSLLDVGLPVALRSFQITQLDSLRCLPEKLYCLTSLENLDICHCTQLHSLPEDGLPLALRNLHIHSCPLLKEQCQREGGVDWFKIAHIPYIYIDGQQISPCSVLASI